MIFAILELRNAQRDGLGPVARQLLDLLQFLPQLLGVPHLIHDLLRNRLVALEEVQQFLAHAVDQLRADFRVAQLVLRLGLENRIFQPDRQYSFTALSNPSRKALKCVPPSLVNWPFTKEKNVSP